MEGQLNLEFLWLPKEEELSDLNSILAKKSEGSFKPTGPLLKLKTGISNFCGFPIFLKDCKKRVELADCSINGEKRNKTENSLFYLEFLFNVFCTIRLEKNPEDDFRRFVDLFCSVKHDRLAFDVYLKFDPAVFPVNNKHIQTEDHAINLNKFSLGNFVGLTTFHERFDSASTLEKEEHKITQVRLQILNDYKKMLLYYVVGKITNVKKRNATTHLLHKMEIPYSSLHSIVISKCKGLIVYFRLLLPPLIYSIMQTMDEEEEYISFFDMRATPWFRSVDLFKGCNNRLRKELSMNTVLKLDFQKNEYDFLFQLITHCKSIQLFFAPVVVRKLQGHQLHFAPKLDDFECFYALQCILTHSFEVVDQLNLRKEAEEVQKFLQSASQDRPHALKEALHLIFEASIKGNVVNFKHCVRYLYERLKPKAPREVIEGFSEREKQHTSGGHLLLIKRAILTPTHLVLLPPQPMLKSKALRDCNPNYSLRVSIRDVNMDTINFTLKAFGSTRLEKQKAFYESFFKNHLLKGFSLHKRLYKYVGNSTSQLKGHGMWFYAQDDKNRTAETLRSAFGQLEKIKEVPRYMARLGQTFSQSMGFITVPQEWTNVNDPEPDVTGGRKQYLVIQDSKREAKSKKKFLKCIPSESDTEEAGSEEEEDSEPYTFSDGVGRISMELAEEVYKKLDVEEQKPCAMQIRYAGCKGMLVVDPRLEGKKILFRKSMVKFKSSHDSLEILKFSEKRSAFLNRPFITILEGLGVNKETFLQLQKEMIQNHITSMFHEGNACQFLHRHSLLRFDFLSMFSAGIRFTEDPLFRSMIFALFQKQIELLKNKANIEIPVNKGRNMFGLMDDTFTLEYGQVFVQYTHFETDEPIILTGTVVVTKNPCMHPGDVRKFEAVNVEGLHHIVDCIVFPAKGPRPHPDEMAGSDLDGDEYHVMWYEEFIFPLDNAAPMHFAQRKNKDDNEDIKCPVQVSDELDHFGEFIFCDKVGIIASAHLAWADQEKQGIYSNVCIRLAAQYSLALDFPKTGRGVSFGQDSVRRYPDFMQKLDEKRTYLSTKALGILYRSCKRLELGLETQKNEIDYRMDRSLVHPDYSKYKKSALKVLNRYCDKIEFYIRTYGFENEGQLLGGALINPPKYYENRHDMSNLMALLEFEIQFIFRDLERKFFDEFGGKPRDGAFSEEMMQKASAWYVVSYEKGGSRFFGLPWAVSDVLVQLKNRSASSSEGVHKKSKSLLETVVDQSVSKHYPDVGPDSDSDTIYVNRLQVLDTALKILTRWVKSQREYFSDPDFRLISKCISREFESLTTDIATCSKGYIDVLKRKNEIKKAVSPCYNVIQTMLHVAQIGSQSPHQKVTDLRQELGLLAWITLIKLACTYNPQYLGIPNEAGVYADAVFYKPQDNIIDTLQLPLFERDNEANRKFSEVVTHNFQKLEEYLKQQTCIKNIDFRVVSGNDNTEFVRFTVEGTRYSIERLKDIVVMDDFFYAAVANKPLLHSV